MSNKIKKTDFRIAIDYSNGKDCTAEVIYKIENGKIKVIKVIYK
jgi:hypothetical protein